MGILFFENVDIFSIFNKDLSGTDSDGYENPGVNGINRVKRINRVRNF